MFNFFGPSKEQAEKELYIAVKDIDEVRLERAEEKGWDTGFLDREENEFTQEYKVEQSRADYVEKRTEEELEYLSCMVSGNFDEMGIDDYFRNYYQEAWEREEEEKDKWWNYSEAALEKKERVLEMFDNAV